MGLRFGSLPLGGSQNCAAVLVGDSYQAQPGVVTAAHEASLRKRLPPSSRQAQPGVVTAAHEASLRKRLPPSSRQAQPGVVTAAHEASLRKRLPPSSRQAQPGVVTAAHEASLRKRLPPPFTLPHCQIAWLSCEFAADKPWLPSLARLHRFRLAPVSTSCRAVRPSRSSASCRLRRPGLTPPVILREVAGSPRDCTKQAGGTPWRTPWDTHAACMRKARWGNVGGFAALPLCW